MPRVTATKRQPAQRRPVIGPSRGSNAMPGRTIYVVLRTVTDAWGQSYATMVGPAYDSEAEAEPAAQAAADAFGAACVEAWTPGRSRQHRGSERVVAEFVGRGS